MTFNSLFNNYFENDELIFENYDRVSWFLIQKLRQDIPRSSVDYYTNCRGLRCVVLTIGDLTIYLELELGYVEFCGVEYDFNLFEIVKLVKAIQHYIIKYSEVDITNYTYIMNPWGF